ncbi:MAG: L-2-hydroxyglutarate oxidase [Microthrixaceae bacterium]|nr:L-2-hydroxyglutarate oxidase [Microthrixaceae bacterium]
MARIVVVGGGIVGLAVARAVAMRGDDVVVFEKEDRVAAHQTGHNSGVVHAGIYYAPGTLKAELCRLGRDAIREYCAEKGLTYRELGKLVVALDESEIGALDALEVRAAANEVPGLRRIGAEEIREIEPHAVGIAALHSPHTAAVDYSAISEAMAEDIRAAGGRVVLGAEVTEIRRDGVGVRVVAGNEDVYADRLIACAGLQSDVVAKLVGADPSPRILPFRGEYWVLDPARADLVRGMIYPVPDPRFPFLGVHFTRGFDDGVHVGPNAVPALAREGYGWGTVSVRDTWGSLMWPGAFPLARKHWRMGVSEVWGSLVKSAYFRQAQRFMPELTIGDLTHKSGAGVRAQAWGRDGSLLDDFAIDTIGPITILRNAPSPAATSSIAIADYLLAAIDRAGS